MSFSARINDGRLIMRGDPDTLHELIVIIEHAISVGTYGATDPQGGGVIVVREDPDDGIERAM